jgi:hypothetical protein
MSFEGTHIAHYKKVDRDELKRMFAVSFHGEGLITIDTSVLSKDEQRELLEVLVSLFGTVMADPLTGDLFEDD